MAEIAFRLRVLGWLLTIGIAASGWAGTERNPLLPHPQQIAYGSGAVSVRGLQIQLPRDATAEDWFAAHTLSDCLSRQTRTPILIVSGEAASHVIRLHRTGTVAALPAPGEKAGAESREAYSLTVRPNQVDLEARSTAGLFYGAETACQLVEGSGEEAELPIAEIHDWPMLAYRGVMVDMSHGPLPTEEEVKRQLDFLARWKANQYYFYSEASIELEGYPLLNSEGRFSQDAVRRIIDYGRERHIDVIPCLELYGHLHDLFRVEKYSDLADVPHGTEFDPRNPKVASLLTDWISQLIRLFPSAFVHIGFDETFQIEIAAQKAGVEASPAQLFIQQLNRVAGQFQQSGRTVMAWGDIIVKYPGIVSQLPPGLMAVAWYYHPGPLESYWHWLGPLVEHRVPHLIATSVTSWNQISPNFTVSFQNIDQFIDAGRKSGALGLMNTIWTDDAQMLMRPTWLGMAYGAVAAWQSQSMDQSAFFSEYSRRIYPADVAPEVAKALEDLDRSEQLLEKVLGSQTMIALWRNPFDPALLKAATAHLADLRDARLRAEQAEEDLDRALAAGADPLTLSSLRFGSRLLDYAGQKFQTVPELEELWRNLGPKRPSNEVWSNNWFYMVVHPDHSRLADLKDTITTLRRQYRSLWLSEYSPYRLDSALGNWDAEYEYWRSLQARLLDFSQSSREGDPLPPLESFAPRQ